MTELRERGAADLGSAAPRPSRLADGVELLGEMPDSGFKRPPYLARRADGQVLQISRLLHAIAEAADGSRSYDEIAREVRRRLGRRVSPRNVRTLVEDKLRPLGLVAPADGSAPILSKPDPLLALRMRARVLSPRVVHAITTVFYPLFFPPVIVGAVVAIGVMDWWVFVHHGVAQAVRQTVLHPALFLGMFALVVASAFFHECGHATGCRYGGAQPGVIGAGVYLAFPAFYTDVTDAYRLDKRGKLRTDLGGVYFNGLFLLGTFAAYLATGFEPLLFLILVQHVEVVHQFLPFLRLDGYYIVADAVGVPDLFARIGPILRGALPWHWGRPSRAVSELKPWVRLFVTAWVLVVVPFLLFNLALLLLHLPRLLGTGAQSVAKQWQATSAAFGDGNVLLAAGGLLQVVALLLPLAGIVYTLWRIASRVGARAWAWSADSLPRRGAVFTGTLLVGMLLVRAWLPGDGRYQPIRPDERGTFAEAAARVTPIVTGDPPALRERILPGPHGGDLTPAPEPTPVVSTGVSTAPASPASQPSPSASSSPAPSPAPSPAETSSSPTPSVTVSP